MRSERFEEFRRVQEQLRARVIIEPLQREPKVIAATDLHIGKDGVGYAAAVLANAHGEMLEQRVVRRKTDVPYVPGFLSFREMPLCRDAILSLNQRPDVILVDGQGIAHPRRFGLACHLGVELDLPTIGVAKSILAGKGDQPGTERGSMSPLMIGNDVVGMSLRTRANVRPVYVSAGNRITLDEAVQITLRFTSRYRLPDPSRLAHRLARNAAATRSGDT